MRAALLLLVGLTAGTVIGYHTAARLGRWALGYQTGQLLIDRQLTPTEADELLRWVREGR